MGEVKCKLLLSVELVSVGVRGESASNPSLKFRRRIFCG
jgi:hypothetical protein